MRTYLPDWQPRTTMIPATCSAARPTGSRPAPPLADAQRASLARVMFPLSAMIYRLEMYAGYVLAAVWGWAGGMWITQAVEACARSGC